MSKQEPQGRPTGLERFSLTATDASRFHCWGAQICGHERGCDPEFAASGQHFKDKFCARCRNGIPVEARFCGALTRGSPADSELLELFGHIKGVGFWKELYQAGRTGAITSACLCSLLRTLLRQLPFRNLRSPSPAPRSLRVPHRQQHEGVHPAATCPVSRRFCADVAQPLERDPQSVDPWGRQDRSRGEARDARPG